MRTGVTFFLHKRRKHFTADFKTSIDSRLNPFLPSPFQEVGSWRSSIPFFFGGNGRKAENTKNRGNDFSLKTCSTFGACACSRVKYLASLLYVVGVWRTLRTPGIHVILSLLSRPTGPSPRRGQALLHAIFCLADTYLARSDFLEQL